MNENADAPAPYKASGYSWYVLAVLVLVYVLNFVDRNILSILAEDLKRDLNLTDADLGFLYGTAFGIFYALFGIPLGRLADNWHRIRLMTVGLSLWSMMTALSGLSRTGGELAVARVGVGVGEATASPCAYSIISDYFPKRQRATALAIYSSGLYLGGGLSLFIGGAVVERWNSAFPGGGPFGLVGWQAAFMAVGLPGLLLALLVFSLREPIRGQSDGLAASSSQTPFRDFASEVITVIPPLTLIGAWRRGPAAFAINLGFGALMALGAWAMIRLTKQVPQWSAMGIGIYAVFSWVTALRNRDVPTFRLIWGTPAFLYIVFGYGLIAFAAYAVGYWGPVYAIRELGASPQDAGFWMGGGGALGGFIGVIAGGRIADWLREGNPSGRIIVAMVGAVAPAVPLFFAYTQHDLTLLYILSVPTTALSSCALGASAATALDLVLPRMRGTATASFFIGTTVLGLAMGPYVAGQISDLTGSLQTGILSMLAVGPFAILFLALAYRAVPRAEDSMLDRARTAGDAI